MRCRPPFIYVYALRLRCYVPHFHSTFVYVVTAYTFVHGLISHVSFTTRGYARLRSTLYVCSFLHVEFTPVTIVITHVHLHTASLPVVTFITTYVVIYWLRYVCLPLPTNATFPCGCLSGLTFVISAVVRTFVTLPFTLISTLGMV